MTVSERIREVGLLRAAGATRRQVVGFILAQAVILGVLGSRCWSRRRLRARGWSPRRTSDRSARSPSRASRSPPSAFGSSLRSPPASSSRSPRRSSPPAAPAGSRPVEALRHGSNPAAAGAPAALARCRLRRRRCRGLAAWPRGAGEHGVLRAARGLRRPAGRHARCRRSSSAPLGRLAGVPFAALCAARGAAGPRCARPRQQPHRADRRRPDVGLAMIVAVGGVAPRRPPRRRRLARTTSCRATTWSPRSGRSASTRPPLGRPGRGARRRPGHAGRHVRRCLPGATAGRGRHRRARPPRRRPPDVRRGRPSDRPRGARRRRSGGHPAAQPGRAPRARGSATRSRSRRRRPPPSCGSRGSPSGHSRARPARRCSSAGTTRPGWASPAPTSSPSDSTRGRSGAREALEAAARSIALEPSPLERVEGADLRRARSRLRAVRRARRRRRPRRGRSGSSTR